MSYNHNDVVDWQTSPNTLSLQVFSASREIARITPEGILHFQIAANDENAKLFVECVERYIAGRALTGVNVKVVDTTADTSTDLEQQAREDRAAGRRSY